ncbi:hypothetical protein IFM89_008907, partial [Coptis chinensis]
GRKKMQRESYYGDGRTFTSPISSLEQKTNRSSFNNFTSSLDSSSLSFTPSPCSCTDESSNNVSATENRLHLARLTLDYEQLVNRYGLCLNHLQEAVKEAENLSQENSNLRNANKDLMKRLTVLAQVSFRNRYLSSGVGFPSLSIVNDFRNLCIGGSGDNGGRYNGGNHVIGVDVVSSPTSVIIDDEKKIRFDEKKSSGSNVGEGGERVALPKSISIRSSGYLKMNQQLNNNKEEEAAGIERAGGTSSSITASAIRTPAPAVPSPVTNLTQRVFVPGGSKDQEALEFDVFNQGMLKTELCNKWQETGDCPYGNNCQFAHGINELRPVIRHPRYKTEVCRMVLAGENCPYGHRCHFRHALTEQERLTGVS